MRIVVRLHIENLRRAGFATGRIARQTRVPVGRAMRADDHAFHHLPHGNGGLRLENALRSIRAASGSSALFQNQLRLDQQPAIGNHRAGPGELDGGRADLLPHGNGCQRSRAPAVEFPEQAARFRGQLDARLDARNRNAAHNHTCSARPPGTQSGWRRYCWISPELHAWGSRRNHCALRESRGPAAAARRYGS